jgi:hypothetical protein
MLVFRPHTPVVYKLLRKVIPTTGIPKFQLHYFRNKQPKQPTNQTNKTNKVSKNEERK